MRATRRSAWLLAGAIGAAASNAAAQAPTAPPDAGAVPEGQVAVPIVTPPPAATAPPPTAPAPAAVATAPPPTAPPTVPPPCTPEPEEPWKDERGARLTGGLSYTEGIGPGGFGRLEMETYSLRRPDESWIGGVLFGLEGWGSRDGGGGGIPMTMFTGFREDTSVFATVGAGWSWAIYDRVRRDGGFGIFAPLAAVSFGVDLEGVRIVADGRAQYRWQWDAKDRYQLEAGLTFGVTTDH